MAKQSLNEPWNEVSNVLWWIGTLYFFVFYMNWSSIKAWNCLQNPDLESNLRFYLFIGVSLRLPNCAPCLPSRLRALSIIDMCFTRLRALPIINTCVTRLCVYVPSSISALPAFFLCCVVLFQLKSKVSMFCVCAPINHLHIFFSTLIF